MPITLNLPDKATRRKRARDKATFDRRVAQSDKESAWFEKKLTNVIKEYYATFSDANVKSAEYFLFNNRHVAFERYPKGKKS